MNTELDEDTVVARSVDFPEPSHSLPKMPAFAVRDCDIVRREKIVSTKESSFEPKQSFGHVFLHAVIATQNDAKGILRTVAAVLCRSAIPLKSFSVGNSYQDPPAPVFASIGIIPSDQPFCLRIATLCLGKQVLPFSSRQFCLILRISGI